MFFYSRLFRIVSEVLSRTPRESVFCKLYYHRSLKMLPRLSDICWFPPSPKISEIRNHQLDKKCRESPVSTYSHVPVAKLEEQNAQAIVHAEKILVFEYDKQVGRWRPFNSIGCKHFDLRQLHTWSTTNTLSSQNFQFTAALEGWSRWISVTGRAEADDA